MKRVMRDAHGGFYYNLVFFFNIFGHQLYFYQQVLVVYQVNSNFYLKSRVFLLKAYGLGFSFLYEQTIVIFLEMILTNEKSCFEFLCLVLTPTDTRC